MTWCNMRAPQGVNRPDEPPLPSDLRKGFASCRLAATFGPTVPAGLCLSDGQGRPAAFHRDRLFPGVALLVTGNVKEFEAITVPTINPLTSEK
jgi:hypothetical protein